MYFVTLCTFDHGNLFGEITAGRMILNAYGQIVADTWLWLSQQYPYVTLDAWIIMPNHFHGILVIEDINQDKGNNQGGSRTAPTEKTPSSNVADRKPLGRLIGAFKTVSTKQINHLRDTAGAPVWQRNYYEHILRDENGLNSIRYYIVTNPERWAEDSLFRE